MKKKTIPFLIILTIVISIIYTTILINKNKNEKKNIDENIEIENTEIEIEETIEEPKYKDENQVPISLYIEQGDQLVKISEYSCDWSPENVLNLFYAIPSTEESISSYNFTFPKVMTYLYDDVNLVPGKPYYHITQDVMYDYTIASSIKLVGDVDSDKIEGPITLTAFCFDSEDDFDEEGNYRGNSKYTITITRE